MELSNLKNGMFVPARIANCMKNAGFKCPSFLSKEDAKKEMVAFHKWCMEIDAYKGIGMERWKALENFGPKSLRDLRRLAGISLIQHEALETRRCFGVVVPKSVYDDLKRQAKASSL